MFITLFFFFKQKTAYEMRISDWSSDVCSSDLNEGRDGHAAIGVSARRPHRIGPPSPQRRSSRSGDGASWTSLFTGDPDDRPRSRVPAHHPPRRALPCRRSGRGAAELSRLSSEERRVGKECVSTCRSRRKPYHTKKNKQEN